VQSALAHSRTTPKGSIEEKKKKSASVLMYEGSFFDTFKEMCCGILHFFFCWCKRAGAKTSCLEELEDLRVFRLERIETSL
jgi:hypothetical protein